MRDGGSEKSLREMRFEESANEGSYGGIRDKATRHPSEPFLIALMTNNHSFMQGEDGEEEAGEPRSHKTHLESTVSASSMHRARKETRNSREEHERVNLFIIPLEMFVTRIEQLLFILPLL